MGLVIIVRFLAGSDYQDSRAMKKVYEVLIQKCLSNTNMSTAIFITELNLDVFEKFV